MSYVGSHLWALRQKFGSDPLLYPGVFVVVFNAKGQVLLGWREQFNGWSALGGSMELGEDISTTMKREVEEETGVPVASATFFGMLTGWETRVVYPHGDVTQPVNALFAVQLAHDDVHPDEEHTRFAWFEKEALPEGTTPQTRKLFALYDAFLKTGQVQVL